jgi:hypothetical protein
MANVKNNNNINCGCTHSVAMIEKNNNINFIKTSTGAAPALSAATKTNNVVDDEEADNEIDDDKVDDMANDDFYDYNGEESDDGEDNGNGVSISTTNVTYLALRSSSSIGETLEIPILSNIE